MNEETKKSDQNEQAAELSEQELGNVAGGGGPITQKATQGKLDTAAPQIPQGAVPQIPQGRTKH